MYLSDARDSLYNLHDDMHEYGGQYWSKKLFPILEALKDSGVGDE